MTIAPAGWWRREHAVPRPTSKVSGGCGAVAIEVRWSTGRSRARLACSSLRRWAAHDRGGGVGAGVRGRRL
jgi:hypothetical protein